MNDHSYPPSNERNAEHFARSVALRLSEGTQQLPYDISERLRASRMQALARRKKPVAILHAAGSVHRAGHSAVLGTGPQGMGWWQSLLSAVPVLALLAGLVAPASVLLFAVYCARVDPVRHAVSGAVYGSRVTRGREVDEQVRSLGAAVQVLPTRFLSFGAQFHYNGPIDAQLLDDNDAKVRIRWVIKFVAVGEVATTKLQYELLFLKGQNKAQLRAKLPYGESKEPTFPATCTREKWE